MHDLAAHHPVGNGHSFSTCERDTRERSERDQKRSEEIRRDQKRSEERPERERERPERDPKRKDNQYIGTCYM
jgi:hypothetical protein